MEWHHWPAPHHLSLAILPPSVCVCVPVYASHPFAHPPVAAIFKHHAAMRAAQLDPRPALRAWIQYFELLPYRESFPTVHDHDHDHGHAARSRKRRYHAAKSWRNAYLCRGRAAGNSPPHHLPQAQVSEVKIRTNNLGRPSIGPGAFGFCHAALDRHGCATLPCWKMAVATDFVRRSGAQDGNKPESGVPHAKFALISRDASCGERRVCQRKKKKQKKRQVSIGMAQ